MKEPKDETNAELIAQVRELMAGIAGYSTNIHDRDLRVRILPLTDRLEEAEKTIDDLVLHAGGEGAKKLLQDKDAIILSQAASITELYFQMGFVTFQRQVHDWHISHFGEDCPPWKPMLKATEELGEAARAVNLNDPTALADEAADVFIALAAVLSRSGVDLNAAIAKRWPEIQARPHDRVKENFRRP